MRPCDIMAHFGPELVAFTLSSNPDIRFSINIPEAGLSRAEAKAAIDTLKGKSYTNRETGISARLSSTGAGKLIGNAATGKTQANGFSKEQHNALAAMIDELFENAYFVSSKPDDDGDKNIASIKRFVCPVTVADTEAGAYITIKESVQHGHRIYSIDGIKIEELSPMVRRVIADRNAAESSSSFSLPQSAYVVNVGTRFSISAQEDADYLAAVNRGDMETAARMVREAAAKAMPDTKAVDENGDPLVVYHSTDADFTKFDRARLGENTDLNAGDESARRMARLGFWFNEKTCEKSSIKTEQLQPTQMSITHTRRRSINYGIYCPKLHMKNSSMA